MLVGISYNNDFTQTISSVTYNGIALSEVISDSDSDDAYMAIYNLTAPPTGTYDVNVTLSATLQANHDIIVGVMTFANVNQTDPLGTPASFANDNGGPASVSVNSATGELVLSVFAGEDDCRDIAVDDETERWNEDPGQILHPGTLGQSELGGGSTQPGAASVEMNWTLDDDHWALGAVPIRPYIDGPPVTTLTAPPDANVTSIANVNFTCRRERPSQRHRGRRARKHHLLLELHRDLARERLGRHHRDGQRLDL